MSHPTPSKSEEIVNNLPQTSLLDLNYYCLLHVCSYLPTIDKLKLLCVSHHFDEIIKSIDIDWVKFLRTFSSEEIDLIFERVGTKINTITYIIKNSEDYPIHLRKLVLLSRHFNLNVDLDLASHNPYILNDESSKLVANLWQLRSLDFSNNDITGKYLSKLKKLKHLKFRYCYCIEPQYFNDIMESNQLKTLSIACCELLDNSSIEIIVRTQTELESIEIGRNYSATNIEIICQLKSLKKLHILGMNCLTVLSKAVVLLADNLQELTIATPGMIAIPELRQKILQFSNLRILRLDGAETLPTDQFLRDIVVSCSRLEELHIPKSSKITEMGILDCVKNARHLKVLNLIGCYEFNRTLFFKLAEVMQKRSGTPLKIYAYRTSLRKYFLKTDEYKESIKLLRLSFEAGNAYIGETEAIESDDEDSVPVNFFIRLCNRIKSFF